MWWNRNDDCGNDCAIAGCEGARAGDGGVTGTKFGSKAVPRAAKRTIQFRIGYPGCSFLPERGFAAIHVHHAAHAAFALAEGQRNTSKRAGCQHEQNE